MFDTFTAAADANRIANLVRLGVIAELDLAAGTARVEFEEGWISDGLPWMNGAAGDLRVWSAPTVGEQVAVLSPSGEPAMGFILRGLFSNAFPAPSNGADLTRLEWADGAQDDYDAAAHARVLNLPAGATVVVRIGGSIAAHIAGDRVSLKVGGSEALIEPGRVTVTSAELLLGGAGGKAVARHDDPVVAGKVVATSTKVKAL